MPHPITTRRASSSPQKTNKTGRHIPSNTDIIALLKSHKPDVLLLTETPTSKDCDALCGILFNKGYHIHYHTDNTPLIADNMPHEARIPTSLTNSRGECTIAHIKTAP